MRISVVSLTSDSSDNEDVDIRCNVNGLKYTRDKSSTLQSAHKFICENEKCDVEQRVPLFKIIFRDESTSRIYRNRLEYITKYLVSEKLGEDSEFDSGDLILEVYEPTKDSNTTINSDTTAELIDNNQNCSHAFNFEREMKMTEDGVKSQNNYVLPTKSFDQTVQPVNSFDASNWETQQCQPQPHEVQKTILQLEFSSAESFNVRKRKWVDDSDSTVSNKKIRVEYASESLPHIQNESVTLENAEKNASKTLYYDPVWYNSSNTQTIAEIIPQEKTKATLSQAKNTNSSVVNEKSSTTFTYRVLKVGTFDYTTKRTFSISKDGIQFYAHHLSEASTLVKVNIEIANMVKIEASFSQILPALFLYVNDKAAMVVKEALGLNNHSTAYFDPQSTDENCNKIIILPDHMPENCRVLKNLLKVGLISNLDKESSGSILRNSFSRTLERQGLQNKYLANELFLNLPSHSVRIGTYKSSKIKFNVVISNQGIQFQIPKIKDDEIYKKITVGFTEIDKLYFSLKKVSALFLHVNFYCAQRIRSLIGMSETDTKKVFFNPDSENMAEQRLVILFNKIKPQQQETLKNLLSYTQSREISLDKIIHQMLFNHM